MHGVICLAIRLNGWRNMRIFSPVSICFSPSALAVHITTAALQLPCYGADVSAHACIMLRMRQHVGPAWRAQHCPLPNASPSGWLMRYWGSAAAERHRAALPDVAANFDAPLGSARHVVPRPAGRGAKGPSAVATATLARQCRDHCSAARSCRHIQLQPHTPALVWPDTARASTPGRRGNH